MTRKKRGPAIIGGVALLLSAGPGNAMDIDASHFGASRR